MNTITDPPDPPPPWFAVDKFGLVFPADRWTKISVVLLRLALFSSALSKEIQK
jgi:hypothetical protein